MFTGAFSYFKVRSQLALSSAFILPHQADSTFNFLSFCRITQAVHDDTVEVYTVLSKMLRSIIRLAVPDFINIRSLKDQVSPSVNDLHGKTSRINVRSDREESIIGSIIIWRECGWNVERKQIQDLDGSSDLGRTAILIGHNQRNRVISSLVNWELE